MAIVMALGIITNGVLFNYIGMDTWYVKLISLYCLSLWLVITLNIFQSLCIRKNFIALHLTDKVNRFGVGTWIAATNIICILIHEEFSQWSIVANILGYWNLFLWLVFIGFSLKTMAKFFFQPIEKVHGVILLTTVSTQSIVVMNSQLNLFSVVLNKLFIVTGILFYLFCLYLIIKRYLKVKWMLETDWKNTNCIIHGALSITGVACSFTHSFSSMVMILWFIVCFLFIFIESIEVIRLLKRMNKFGFRMAFMIYDTSQWSRIFTFGMFYTFTIFLKPTSTLVMDIKEGIINVGIWVIFVLLLFQMFLLTKQVTLQVKTIRKDPHSMEM